MLWRRVRAKPALDLRLSRRLAVLRVVEGAFPMIAP